MIATLRATSGGALVIGQGGDVPPGRRASGALASCADALDSADITAIDAPCEAKSAILTVIDAKISSHESSRFGDDGQQRPQGATSSLLWALAVRLPSSVAGAWLLVAVAATRLLPNLGSTLSLGFVAAAYVWRGYRLAFEGVLWMYLPPPISSSESDIGDRSSVTFPK